jgi:hypothetical protein
LHEDDLYRTSGAAVHGVYFSVLTGSTPGMPALRSKW